jgi:hypothetical protein
MPNQEHERERDQTHSYWYIPSAPRVNYSLLVMETAGMMKMATGDGFPLWQGAGMGSRLVFHGYRGLRRRNFRSRFISGGFGIYRRCWRRGQVKGAHEATTRQGACPRGGALHPCGCLGTPLRYLFVPVFFIFSKNILRKFSAHSENFYFCTKNDTTVVLLKRASVRVSSNQIIPKSYRIVVNMA